MGDDDVTRVKGKVEEAVGWATGDRRTEARGKVEREKGEPPEDGELEQVEDEVREDHGDI